MRPITRIRDLDPGDRFYLLRTMERHQYVARDGGGWAGTRHIVKLDGEARDGTLHHSCHVKLIVRAA